MSQERQLTDLKNIGPIIARRLNEIGVYSEDELRKVGSVEAHRRLKEKYPQETLPVCYYLYSFEGALCNQHWNNLDDKRKQQLKEKI